MTKQPLQKLTEEELESIRRQEFYSNTTTAGLPSQHFTKEEKKEIADDHIQQNVDEIEEMEARELN